MTLSEDDPTYLRIFTDLTVPADKADELAVLREGNRLEYKLKCVESACSSTRMREGTSLVLTYFFNLY